MDGSFTVTADATNTSLLRSAVVALEVPSSPTAATAQGTGFLVAPRVIATCAHVLAQTRSELPPLVLGSLPGHDKKLDLAPVSAWYFGTDEGGLDLAFLWVCEESDAPHVVLSQIVETGDPLLAYGHPAGLFRGGQTATFHYAGPSRLVATDTEWEPQRVVGTPVSAGYSGSPVLNQRSGAVCGMLCLSNDRGSAHMVGAADILRHLPEDAIEAQARESSPGTAAWLATLTDAQIQVGGWRYPGPHLHEYLETVSRASLNSYPIVDSNVAYPELPSVYVDQLARQALTALGNQVTVPATTVFEQEGHALISGGPGLGKSSLLRVGLRKLAKAWLAGHIGAAIPVRVHAADLVDPRPLPQLIASSVEADLSAVGIMNSWPSEFFGVEPLRGVRWMVLVDGLDDIIDSESRRGVITKLAGIACDSKANPYQFIITSRPLSVQELAQEDSWIAAWYELQPFGAQQLRQLAEHLLTGLGAEAEATVQRLVGELDRASLTDLAGVPLMATMLCQLLAIDHDRRLPTDLVSIYEEFVHTLASPQYVPGARGIYHQAEKAFAPYGHPVVRAAAAVLDRSAELLARLALAKHDGVEDSALDLLVAWESEGRPSRVPEKPWREFLKGILRRSGLLTERLDDFVFIHETIGDYLAARSVVADESRSFATFEQLFYRWQRPWPGIAEEWRQPGWSYSYIRFLIALWPERIRTINALRQIAEFGGLGGCQFIASLVEDGIVIDSTVINAASAALGHITSKSVSYGFAARRAFVLLRHLGALDWLAKIMTDELVGEEIRDRAAITLAEFGDSRGADRLVALATNRDRDALDRLDAYDALDRLDDNRAADLLVGVFRALAIEMDGPDVCELILARMGEERGADFLAKIVVSQAASPEMYDSAAFTLERHGDPRGVELLGVKVGHSNTPISRQLAAPAVIAGLHDPRAARVLRFIATNKSLSGRVRLQGTEILARQHNPHVPNLLAAIARDSLAELSARTEAVATLAKMGAKENLIDLARPQAADRAIRMEAIKALIGLADESDMDSLSEYARDSRVSPHLRAAAAETLDLLRAPEAVDDLDEIAQDQSAGESYRHQTAKVTGEHSLSRIAVPGHGSAARVRLFIALSMWPSRRIGSTIEEPGDFVVCPQCLDTLFAFARDTAVGFKVRKTAAYVLTLLGDPRGPTLTKELSWWPDEEWIGLRPGTVDVCLALVRAATASEPQARVDVESYRVDISECLDLLHSIAVDATEQFRTRRYSAEVLARLDDVRGNDLLVQFLDTPSLTPSRQCQVAGSLARADDMRGPDFLRAMARNKFMSVSVRREATMWLRWIGDPYAGRLTRSISVSSRALRDQRTKTFRDLDLAFGVRASFEDASLMVDLETRKLARLALAHFSNPESVRTLLAIAADSAASFEQRREAVKSLALQGASAELSQIAEDMEFDSTVRCWAAEEASWLGEPRGAEVLVSLVGSRSVDSYTRRRAAHFLVRLSDPRGIQLLADLATDPITTIDARHTASQLLTQLDFVDTLLAFVLDPQTNDDARINAIEILASNNKIEALSRLQSEPTLPNDTRQRLSRALRQANSANK
jgi:hypothetical protein